MLSHEILDFYLMMIFGLRPGKRRPDKAPTPAEGAYGREKELSRGGIVLGNLKPGPIRVVFTVT